MPCPICWEVVSVFVLYPYSSSSSILLLELKMMRSRDMGYQTGPYRTTVDESNQTREEVYYSIWLDTIVVLGKRE
jgi:hypothetical protein